ncbi:hypothetical protein QVM82_02105, partial [Enterobacter asburiae]
MQTVIRVEKLSKTFNHNKALHAVDLTVQQGEMVALLGPSGCSAAKFFAPKRIKLCTAANERKTAIA